MKLNDPLYRKVEINEPVLLDLINTQAVKRLQGISLAGYNPNCPRCNHPCFDRYNHSIGVLLLLKRFNAPIEEQIAGLIHDVSHTAFSHTIDYIEDDKESQKDQSTQDKNHHKVIMNSEIPDILKHYGIDINYILDDKNFPLKENDLPDVCADRIDYSLRQFYETDQLINEVEKDFLLDNLTIYNNQFVFKNFDSAKLFADLFWYMDENHWSSLSSAIMLSLGGKLFSYAIKQGYIPKKMLFESNDKEIVDLVRQKRVEDETIRKFMSLAEEPIEHFENVGRELPSDENYIDHIFCKVRKADPYFIQDNSLKRVSDVDNEFKKKIIKAPKFKEYFVKFKGRR